MMKRKLQDEFSILLSHLISKYQTNLAYKLSLTIYTNELQNIFNNSRPQFSLKVI